MKFKIGEKEVGEGNQTFIIAELSANHMNDFDIAVKTIEAMAEAGADAVKFQTFTPDTITIDCDNEYFQIHDRSRRFHRQNHRQWGSYLHRQLQPLCYTPMPNGYLDQYH